MPLTPDYHHLAEVFKLRANYAFENGLLTEWLATFLEHMQNGYSVIESCYHADYEWDL